MQLPTPCADLPALPPNYQAALEAVVAHFRAIDKAGAGTLNATQFRRFCRRLNPGAMSEEEVAELFSELCPTPRRDRCVFVQTHRVPFGMQLCDAHCDYAACFCSPPFLPAPSLQPLIIAPPHPTLCNPRYQGAGASGGGDERRVTFSTVAASLLAAIREGEEEGQ